MANIIPVFGLAQTVAGPSATKQIIDEYLKDFFSMQALQARTVSLRYERLWLAAERLAMAGGKRLRPYIALLAYRAYSSDGPLDEAISAAVACELIHIAMLIHDDVIDRDDVRYGVANISGQYMEEYSNLAPADQRHFANSAAVLMGDALIAESHRLLAISSSNLERLRKAQLAFSTAILHVVGGELIDTEASFRQSNDTHAITVARYKTASYSFVGPLNVGAHLAGADETNIESLKEYADSLGIAFQLKDDLLGSFGDSAITGKSSDTDLKEGKRTYLVEQFDKLADRSTRLRFYELFAKQDSTDQQIDQLRSWLIASGAIEKTEQAIDDYAAKAGQALSQLAIDDQHRKEFENLIAMCVDREK